MKKLIILPFLFFGLFSWAQSQFVVQNGAKTEVYSNINDAITNAVASDTLYIPGGGFNLTNAVIDKSLHWVGHGHYPAATGATMQSRITSALTFTGNCDNSSFEGICFTSSIYFGSASDEATNIMMKRCRIIGPLYLRSATTDNPNLNFNLIECVTSSIDAKNGANCSVEKSMIFGTVSNFYNSQFSHSSFNLFIPVNYSNRSVIRGSVSCTFSSNVFSYVGYLDANTVSCTFNNNLFAEVLPYNELGSNGGSANLINIGPDNVYTTITTNNYTFSYNNDYHLNTSGTGTDDDANTGVSIIGAASDGTNAGIYGTTIPYKENAIPYYPHINTATIATEATNDELGVNINVQAQER